MSAARRVKRHWLVKTEPSTYSIHDLERDRVTPWEGVRNYQARNLLRDELKIGDAVLVYHSSADPLAIVGLARVSSESYPDPSAFDRGSPSHDPESRREDPTWFVVDLEHVETFERPLERDALRREKALAKMMLLRRGARLSVQPVTPGEFEAVLALARGRVRRRG